jgi:hypothetical protein
MSPMSPYKHPRWQRRRLEIMQRDEFRCARCGDSETELNVHHRRYPPRGVPLWEVDDVDLVTLCEPCHSIQHNKHSQTPVTLQSLMKSILPFEVQRHGHCHFIDGAWLCWCGCGEVFTQEQFKRADLPARADAVRELQSGGVT